MPFRPIAYVVTLLFALAALTARPSTAADADCEVKNGGAQLVARSAPAVDDRAMCETTCTATTEDVAGGKTTKVDCTSSMGLTAATAPAAVAGIRCSIPHDNLKRDEAGKLVFQCNGNKPK